MALFRLAPNEPYTWNRNEQQTGSARIDHFPEERIERLFLRGVPGGAAQLEVVATNNVPFPEVAAIPITALALVAVGPSHHRRRRRVMLVNAHGEEAYDVGRKAHLTLDLDHRLVRGVDVHQHIVSLAVLLDAIGEGLQAPIFGLADRPSALLQNGAKTLKEGIDLLGGNILPRQKYMLVKRHG
jgi:hypothetical protein